MSGDQDDEKKIHVKHENKFLIIQVINVMFLRLFVHLYSRLFIHFVIMVIMEVGITIQHEN